MSTFTVSAINDLIKCSLAETFIETVQVEGEVSNVKQSGGHLFLTLKDSDSCLNVTFWRYATTKHRIDITNGEQVIIDGRINTYSKSSNYNLTATKIIKIGQGDLNAEYEKLKQQCTQLGYLNRPPQTIPKYINRLGIVTSIDGAALQDILYVLNKNNFNGKVIIKNCIAQGPQCPQSVAKAIEFLQSYKDPCDVIMITRGGGASEDLMGFSHMLVVKAIYDCPIHTISAVGHEVDTMLSDLVANTRAPTPSIGSELICQQNITTQLTLSNHQKSIQTHHHFINHRLTLEQNKLTLIATKLKNPSIIIDKQINTITNYQTYITNRHNHILEAYIKKLNHIKSRTIKYDINRSLQNGYCLLTSNRNNIIDSITTLKPDQKLKLRLKDGEITITINAIN